MRVAHPRGNLIDCLRFVTPKPAQQGDTFLMAKWFVPPIVVPAGLVALLLLSTFLRFAFNV